MPNKNQTPQQYKDNSISIRNTLNVKSKAKKTLTLKQELFCKLYATDREYFGNGVESYIEAYKVPISKYNTAKSNASRLLTNDNVLDRINELMDITLNDIVVDKELAFTIKQKDNLSAKVSAIREYNQLKQRITNKTELTLKTYNWGNYDDEPAKLNKGGCDSLPPESVDQSIPRDS